MRVPRMVLPSVSLLSVIHVKALRPSLSNFKSTHDPLLGCCVEPHISHSCQAMVCGTTAFWCVSNATAFRNAKVKRRAISPCFNPMCITFGRPSAKLNSSPSNKATRTGEICFRSSGSRCSAFGGTKYLSSLSDPLREASEACKSHFT